MADGPVVVDQWFHRNDLSAHSRFLGLNANLGGPRSRTKKQWAAEINAAYRRLFLKKQRDSVRAAECSARRDVEESEARAFQQLADDAARAVDVIQRRAQRTANEREEAEAREVLLASEQLAAAQIVESHARGCFIKQEAETRKELQRQWLQIALQASVAAEVAARRAIAVEESAAFLALRRLATDDAYMAQLWGHFRNFRSGAARIRLRVIDPNIRARDIQAVAVQKRSFGWNDPFLAEVHIDYCAQLTSLCIALRTSAPNRTEAGTAAAVHTQLGINGAAVAAITEVTGAGRQRLAHSDEMHFSNKNRGTGHGHNATFVPATGPWERRLASDELLIEVDGREYDLPFDVLVHKADTWMRPNGNVVSRRRVLHGAFHSPGATKLKVRFVVDVLAKAVDKLVAYCQQHQISSWVVSLDANFCKRGQRTTVLRELADRLKDVLNVEVHDFRRHGEPHLGAISWNLPLSRASLRPNVLPWNVTDHPNVTEATFQVANLHFCDPPTRVGLSARP